MLKLLGAAVAALVLGVANHAAAATYLYDFEDETPGATSWWKSVDGAAIGSGTIDTLDGNNFLRPRIRSSAPARQNTKVITLNGQQVGIGEYVFPQIISMDVFIAGGGVLNQVGLGTYVIPADTWTTITLRKTNSLGCAYQCSYWFMGSDVRIDNILLDVSIAHVPEPATWAMMIIGFGAAGFGLRRHRNVEVRQRPRRA